MKKLDKKQIFRILKVAVFLLLLFWSFLFCTYLTRNAKKNTRPKILNYYAEPDNSLDVVFLGASNVYKFYDPLQMWEEYGFASRCYSVPGMHNATYLHAVKDALKSQDPEVVVMDIRPFTLSGDYYAPTITAKARNMLDSLDYTWDRFQAVTYYCQKMNIPWEDAVTLYIDLIQYHDNYAVWLSPENWALADNALEENDYKGFGIQRRYTPYEDTTALLSDARNELEPLARELLEDILQYCTQEDIPLLLTCIPSVENEERYQRQNTIADIAEAYGVPFLNMNTAERYQEIGLDFSRDFFDENHVNIIGAGKVSSYMATFLKENYDLPDHRDDPQYSHWHTIYADYILEREDAVADTWAEIHQKESALEYCQEMKAETDTLRWLHLSTNPYITLLYYVNTPLTVEGLPADSALALQALGITETSLTATGHLLGVSCDGVYTVETKRASKTGSIGSESLPYTLRVGEKLRAQVNKVEYAVSSDGIVVLAFNNSTNEVFDQVEITSLSNGKLSLTHLLP